MLLRRFSARPARPGAVFLFALVLLHPRTGRAGDAEPSPIAWHHDYATAFEDARNRKQLLWIQFTGPWCPNCVRMDRDSFSDRSVRELAASGFVAVKLGADENQDLALGFDLTGLPATVVVAPSRQVLAVHQGYLAAEDLTRLLRSAGERHSFAPEDEQRLASGDSPEKPQSGNEPEPRRGSRPKTETQVALSGYCPVSLVSDKRLVQGQTEYTVTHEGRLYRLANLLTFNRFRGDPTRYVPVNNGNCPVEQLDRGAQRPGDPRFGVLFQGRLYLCATGDDRRRFLLEPSRYAAIDVAEQGNCPHCLASEGVKVPGDPRCDLKHEGRRYWFPDASHREAFLATVGAPSVRR